MFYTQALPSVAGLGVPGMNVAFGEVVGLVAGELDAAPPEGELAKVAGGTGPRSELDPALDLSRHRITKCLVGTVPLTVLTPYR